MQRRLLILAILTFNDFHLHLDSYFGLDLYDPTFYPFSWIYKQGTYIYNGFWSLYWGLAFVFVLSLLTQHAKLSPKPERT